MQRQKFNNAIKEVAELFKLLSHADRIRLVGLLTQYKELNVTQLCHHGHISQSATSQHLKLLKLKNVIKERREGKHVYYSLASMQVRNLIIRAIRLESRELIHEHRTLHRLQEMEEALKQERYQD